MRRPILLILCLVLLSCYSSVIILDLPHQIPCEHNTLRPTASAKDSTELNSALGRQGPPADPKQTQRRKPVRISESPEESHYWYLYHRLHELNRLMDSWFTKVRLPEHILDDRIQTVLDIIDGIAEQLPVKIYPEDEFKQLSNKNRELKRQIDSRAKEITRRYHKSLEMVDKPEYRADFEALNQELDRLNKEQTETLLERASVRLALIKKLLGKGPKRRDTAERSSKPLIVPAMALVMGVREDMERITIEIYWKRVRQYIAAYGRKLAKQVEAVGLFGEPQQTVSLDDWDVFIKEKGEVTVRMRQWETVLTSKGQRIVRPVWADKRYPDIVTACRAHVHIMMSEDQEILRIFSYLAQLRYIIRRIESYIGRPLPKNVKNEALAGLAFLYKWFERGKVDAKKLGMVDAVFAVENLEQDEVEKAIGFIENARNRLWERVDEIRKDIRAHVYRRFVALNEERKRLTVRDMDIKQHLRFAQELLGIEAGVAQESINNLTLEDVTGAEDVLRALLKKYFRRGMRFRGVSSAMAKRRIEATISLLGRVSVELEKRMKEEAQVSLPAINREIGRLLYSVLANISTESTAGISRTALTTPPAIEEVKAIPPSEAEYKVIWKKLRYRDRKRDYIRGLTDEELWSFTEVADGLADTASERAFIHYWLWRRMSRISTERSRKAASEQWGMMFDSLLVPEEGGSRESFMGMFKKKNKGSYIGDFFGPAAELELILRYSAKVGALETTIKRFEGILGITIDRKKSIRKIAFDILEGARELKKRLPINSLLKWVASGIYSKDLPDAHRVEPSRPVIIIKLIYQAA